MKRLTPMNKLFIGITSFLFVFIAGTRTAQAIVHPQIANLLVGWVVGFVVGIINTVIGTIAWVFFLIAGWFIDFGLSINSQLANSALIKTGYDIVLSIANLGIIIAIVVIAFMIMLRRSNTSQLLVRFILVAILMNFGLVIVINLLIKPVDEITGIIHDATQFGPTSFGKAFVVPINFGGQIAPPPSGSGDAVRIENTDETIPGLFASVVIDLASVFFSVMFLVMGTIVLFGFAGILFVRYMALAILLILLPIAWLSYIFPGLKVAGGHPFTLWWATFIKWLLFAPISMFFFYLAVKSVDRSVLAGIQTPHFLSDAGAVIGDMVVVIGLMVGGMIVANRMGIYGAGAAMKMVGKVNAYVKSSARQQAIRAASAPLRTDRGEKILKGIQEKSLPRGLQTVVGKPIKAAGRGLISATDRSEKIIVDSEAEKMKNLAPYRLAEIMSDEQGSDLRRMAALKIAQEKGYAWEAPAAQLIARAHKKRLFKKFGLQLLENKLIAEGTPPKAMGTVLDLSASQETANAAVKTELDKASDNDLGKMSRYLLTDFTGDDSKGILGQHGFTEKEFDRHREALSTYLVEERPGLINRIRGGLPGSGQMYLNSKLERYAESRGDFEEQAFHRTLGKDATLRSKQKITSADPSKGPVEFGKATTRDKQLYIHEHWAGVKKSLMVERERRIMSRTDLDAAGKTAELSRVDSELDTLGPEGVIADYETREKARRGGMMFGFLPSP